MLLPRVPTLRSWCALAGPSRRTLVSSQIVRHENPLRSRIKGVTHVIVVASGKGGVGKSTVAANLALALLQTSKLARAPRIGLLDLDVFGPSVPKLMGLERAGEPELSANNKLVPLQNHGIKTMSIGYLLPPSANNDSPVVWRGLMVQKAVQQLLFDVEWADAADADLDVLVVDMPPGTGDVQLSLGQLVVVDGAVVVSTPQDVALLDARKGVAMFRKVDVSLAGLLLNMAWFTCGTCDERHELFGSADAFERAAADMGLDVLGRVPLVKGVSDGGDAGRPVMIQSSAEGQQVRDTMRGVGRRMWEWLGARAYERAGVRG